jgi:hypothetical protein
MVDVEPAILDELERLSPRETADGSDWDDVLRRAGGRPAKPARSWFVRAESRRRRILAAVTAVLALAAAGAAVAGIVLAKSEAEEAQGLLDGHSVFAGTSPVCTQVADDHFRCVLDRPPTGYGTTIEGSYRGSKFQTVDADKRIDGGCVGATDDGRTWDCYLGTLAVRHGILDADLLGQVQPEPGHG